MQGRPNLGSRFVEIRAISRKVSKVAILQRTFTLKAKSSNGSLLSRIRRLRYFVVDVLAAEAKADRSQVKFEVVVVAYLVAVVMLRR